MPFTFAVNHLKQLSGNKRTLTQTKHIHNKEVTVQYTLLFSPSISICAIDPSAAHEVYLFNFHVHHSLAVSM